MNIDTSSIDNTVRRLSEAISPGTALPGSGMHMTERQRQKSAVRDPPPQQPPQRPAGSHADHGDGTAQPEPPTKKVSFVRSQDVIHEYQKIAQTNEMGSFLAKSIYWGNQPPSGQRRRERRRLGKDSSSSEESSSESPSVASSSRDMPAPEGVAIVDET